MWVKGWQRTKASDIAVTATTQSSVQYEPKGAFWVRDEGKESE